MDSTSAHIQIDFKDDAYIQINLVISRFHFPNMGRNVFNRDNFDVIPCVSRLLG